MAESGMEKNQINVTDKHGKTMPLKDYKLVHTAITPSKVEGKRSVIQQNLIHLQSKNPLNHQKQKV